MSQNIPNLPKTPEMLRTFNPSTLKMCSCISCSVCTQRNKIINEVNLTKSCATRKRLIINNFLHSLEN